MRGGLGWDASHRERCRVGRENCGWNGKMKFKDKNKEKEKNVVLCRRGTRESKGVKQITI